MNLKNQNIVSSQLLARHYSATSDATSGGRVQPSLLWMTVECEQCLWT